MEEGYCRVNGFKFDVLREIAMSKDLKMPTKERVLQAAKECDNAETALRSLWPEAFEEEWINITEDLELEMENTGDGWSFLKVAYKGTQVFRIDQKGIDIYRPGRIKIDYNNQAIKVTMKKPKE